MVKVEEDGELQRGYKLGTLRSLLDEAGDLLIKDKWQADPNSKRKKQQIKEIEALEPFWNGLGVPIKGAVVRKKTDNLKKQNHPNGKDGYEYMVFVATKLPLSAKNIILTYELVNLDPNKKKTIDN